MKPKPFLAAILALLFFLSGCISTGPTSSKTGILAGHISIGPLCPVEQNPPDPNCQPTLQTYQAYPLSVYNSSNQKIMEFIGAANGNYQIELQAGTYTIKSETGMQRYSQTVAIIANQTTTQNIDIDTGIR